MQEVPWAIASAVAVLAAVATYLLTRSFWFGVLIGFAFTVLSVLPLALAVQSSRQITQEQKERWGLSVKLTPEQQAHARRLAAFLLVSRLLLLAGIVVAAYLIDSLVGRVIMALAAFALYVLSLLIGVRRARKYFPDVANQWSGWPM